VLVRSGMNVVDLVKCLMCGRAVTGCTAYCAKHVVVGFGRPFVVCSQQGCALPCRGASLCVVHGSAGVARCAFDEDVLSLHRKQLLKAKLASLDIARSQHAGSDDEDDSVAVPSWRVNLFSATGSPLLQAYLEGDEMQGLERRAAKLRKVEQMYTMQVARLEDFLRSGDNVPNDPVCASVRPFVGHIPDSRATDQVIELSQRENGLTVCKRKGCSANAITPSPYCVAHITDDPKQTLFLSCSVPACKVTVLRTFNPGAETCPTHTPPKIIKKS
jgi:hypothetical protein